MKIYRIYCAFHPKTGKRYVGQTTQTLRNRINSHHVRGLEKEVILIAETRSAHQACHLEKYWIDVLQWVEPGLLNMMGVHDPTVWMRKMRGIIKS